MEHFDVVIIGAGPAGLKCAETLGNSGLKTLVVEKNDAIGPKPCGGLITSEAFRYMGSSTDADTFGGVVISTPFRRTEADLGERKLYTINRRELGQSQLGAVRRFGNIMIRTNTLVSAIRSDHIIADGKKISFKYLVGADGSSSMLRRYLGLKTDELGMAVQYVIPTSKYRNIEISFDSKLFGAWYAWILPHKDYVCIGAGADIKKIPTNKLKENLHVWMKRNNIDASGGEYQAHPLNSDYRGLEFGNKFLIGDAAGLIYPFTGEGIHPAMLSGEVVAKRIMDSGYQIDIGDILKRKRKQRNLIVWIEIFPLKSLCHETIAIFSKREMFRKRLLRIIA